MKPARFAINEIELAADETAAELIFESRTIVIDWNVLEQVVEGGMSDYENSVGSRDWTEVASSSAAQQAAVKKSAAELSQLLEAQLKKACESRNHVKILANALNVLANHDSYSRSQTAAETVCSGLSLVLEDLESSASDWPN